MYKMAQQLSREFISENSGAILRTDVDEETGIELFCYINDDVPKNDEIKQYRGIVFDGDQVVLRAFPYTELCLIEDVFGGLTFLTDELLRNDCTCFSSYEGTLIRMFFHKGKWFTTTHRKLDAHKSMWACKKSFGEMFMEALVCELEDNNDLRLSLFEPEEEIKNCPELLTRFQEALDKNKQYMYLIRTIELNKFVCNPPEKPSVLHVGTFINGRLSLDENGLIRKPQSFKFETLDDLCKHVQQTNEFELQGVIVFTNDNRQIKVLKNEYSEWSQVRGNEPSLKYRYLQVRLNPEHNQKLRCLFPSVAEEFNSYEALLYEIAIKIHSLYLERYINKQDIVASREIMTILRKCHEFYNQNRFTNRVTFHVVEFVMNQHTPSILNHLIRNELNTRKRAQAQNEAQNEAQM